MRSENRAYRPSYEAGDGWYKIAEANGMSTDAALDAGTVIHIPAGVMRASNTATTFQPYDPNAISGNLSPTSPKQPPKGHKCGLGQVIVAVIAIAVTAFLHVPLTNFFSGLGFTGGSIAGASTAALVEGGAAAGVAGSVASQAVGVATGIQDKFSWNAVALAGIGGGIGAGLGKVIQGDTFIAGAERGALGSVITQGIGVATGLQSKFSWASVAAAGVSGGILSKAHLTPIFNDPSASNIAANAFVTTVADIASAATRTLVDGSDFGDNMLAAVPDLVGEILGNTIAGRLNSALNPAPTSAAGGMGSAVMQRLLAEYMRQHPFSIGSDPLGGQATTTNAMLNGWAHGSDNLTWLSPGASVYVSTSSANVSSDGSLQYTGDQSGLTYSLSAGAAGQITSNWTAIPGIGVVRSISNGTVSHSYLSGDAYYPDMGLSIRVDEPATEDFVVTGTRRHNDTGFTHEQLAYFRAVRDTSNEWSSEIAREAPRYLPIVGTIYAYNDFKAHASFGNGVALALSLFGDGALAARGLSMLRGIVGARGGAAAGIAAEETAEAAGGAARGRSPWEMIDPAEQNAVVQSGENACGSACGAYVAQRAGFANVTESQLVALVGEGETSAGELSDALREATGREFSGGSVTWNPATMSESEAVQFVDQLSAGGKNPFMALFHAGGAAAREGHWVVAEGVTETGQIRITDPVGLAYSQSAAGFLAAWRTGDIVFPR